MNMKPPRFCLVAALSMVSCLGTLCSRGATGAPDVSWRPAVPAFPKREMSITHFGAVGDGVTLNAGAFASAIEALAEKGGGTLDVPAGFWLTGPIQLRSNINL